MGNSSQHYAKESEAMKRQYRLIGLTIMGAATVLGLLQWLVAWQSNTLPSAFEFVQSWVLITAAILYVGFMATRESKGVADFVRNFFTLRVNLAVPVTILSYLSTTWFAGFHEKYNVTAWHNGLALKGFWLSTIAQSHPSPTNPFPNVHYGFWVNLLQWMVDHSIYSWFGYVVIGGELLIAVAFITAILAVFYRAYLAVAAGGALVGLLFHFWFLMSGSAGVNALMPYLTGIAVACLIGTLVKVYGSVPKTRPVLAYETIAVSEKVATNGKVREPVSVR
jgi:hypothetical protein